MTYISSAALFALISGSLLAQATNDIGFTRGWTTTFTDRVGANNIVADCLNHYDSRSYQDWMLDPADPLGATFLFTAVRFVIQDQIGNTPESYNIVAYNEDPANANFPDPASVWLRSGNFVMPASTATGPVAWIITVTLATPPAAPKGDKWIGLQLSPPAVGTWPTDGASLHCAFDRALASTSTNTSDQAGPRIDSLPNNQIACHMPIVAGVPAGPAVYPASTIGNRRQIRLEILGGANVPGGVCVTQTNQARYASSNPGVVAGATPLGGTTNFISGLHPDVYDGNLSTPARQDDVGFLVTDVNFPNAPVIFLVALGPSPIGSLPMSQLLLGSGSTGNICADFVNGITFVGFSNAAGLAQQMLTLTPAARLQIQGLSAPGLPLDLWWQGFVLNLAAPSGLQFRATGCGIAHL